MLKYLDLINKLIIKKQEGSKTQLNEFIRAQNISSDSGFKQASVTALRKYL